MSREPTTGSTTGTGAVTARSRKAAAASAFGPLRSGVFRRLWLANSVSNLGFWMQQVAAAWLMTELTRSPSLVALLATAAAVPTFLLALPAGALADILDRRRLILLTQLWQMAVAALMGVATLAGAMTPTLLLAGTAVYSLGNTLGLPAFSAILPQIVADGDLTQAIALNGMSFTAAQALGPAVGGALVAAVGAGWAFVANAASFAGVIVILLAWRPPGPTLGFPAEHVLGAIRTGIGYVRNAPAFQIVLVRIGVYMLCYAAIPALLVVAVRTRLHSTVAGFGLALAVFGVGAVLAAVFVLPRLSSRVSVDTVTTLGTVVLATSVLGALATVTTLPAAVPELLVGGAASMLVMSTLQASAQQALPDWVRGRGLAIVQLTFQATLAMGAAGWGALAGWVGTSTALLAAGAAMTSLTLIALAAGARLRVVEDLDLRPAPTWAAPGVELATSLAAYDGPVLTLTEYEIATGDTATFHTAMLEVGRARRRDGALQWTLACDAERPTRHIESYLVTSWVEHEREQSRLTRADARSLQAVHALHRGEEPPVVRYLLGHHRHRGFHHNESGRTELA